MYFNFFKVLLAIFLFLTTGIMTVIMGVPQDIHRKPSINNNGAHVVTIMLTLMFNFYGSIIFISNSVKNVISRKSLIGSFIIMLISFVICYYVLGQVFGDVTAIFFQIVLGST